MAESPAAGGLGGLGDLFSSLGESAMQLFIWQVLGGLVGGLMAPVINDLTQEALRLDSNTVLTPDLLADLVNRQLLDPESAVTEAGKSGVNAQRFTSMLQAAVNTPDVSMVLDAFNRGLIGAGDQDPGGIGVANALTNAGIATGWQPIITKLAVNIPSVAEVMNAWLEGQIDEGEAHTRYIQAGGDPTWFQTSYNANGQAPTPVELLTMLNRGAVPEGGTGPDAVSYDQGFLEGPWRNKWLQAFLSLREYLPPPRTVTAMFHAGQLPHDQAAVLLTKQGLAPDLVAAYLTPSKSTTVGSEKELAKSDVLALYTDGLMPRGKAVAALVALKYPPDDAALLIELADFKAAKAQLTQGMDHVRTLYQADKLSRHDALSELAQLGIAATTAADLVNTWDVTVTQQVRTLSEAQITAAVYYQFITPEDGLARLATLGYDEQDAWVLLAVRLKAAVPGVPPPAGVLAGPR